MCRSNYLKMTKHKTPNFLEQISLFTIHPHTGSTITPTQHYTVIFYYKISNYWILNYFFLAYPYQFPILKSKLCIRYFSKWTLIVQTYFPKMTLYLMTLYTLWHYILIQGRSEKSMQNFIDGATTKNGCHGFKAVSYTHLLYYQTITCLF